MVEFHKKLMTLAVSQKQDCDNLKKFCSPTDSNYRLEWGKLIAYCTVLNELQNDLGIEEDLPVEVEFSFKDLLE